MVLSYIKLQICLFTEVFHICCVSFHWGPRWDSVGTDCMYALFWFFTSCYTCSFCGITGVL